MVHFVFLVAGPMCLAFVDFELYLSVGANHGWKDSIVIATSLFILWKRYPFQDIFIGIIHRAHAAVGHAIVVAPFIELPFISSSHCCQTLQGPLHV